MNSGNDIYSEVYIPDTNHYNGISENAVNDILASINEGNSKDVSRKVIKLATDYSARIEELEAKNRIREKKSLTDVIKVFIDKPEILLIAFFTYAIMLYAFMLYQKKLTNDQLLRAKIESDLMEDYARERNQFIHQKYKSKLHGDE
ncbi:hypothetical protein [Pseudomonas sp.]|uniref:hypothetical protein n=1 Tax=Pseudomonas sp. TaxID=306 RepID=UPI002580BFB5|nr:hypothetical protein [Pseudomonas sp.]